MLISLVIALLLWQTQWISLRPGLSVLLVGQLAAGLLYFLRSFQLKATSAAPAPQMHTWFGEEKRFITVAMLSESLVRILGFVVLAYGFWNATHILWITLLLGAVYPAISYFGVAQRNTRQILRALEQQRVEVERS